VPERLEGIRKSGVHVLDSEAAFARLGRELDGYRRALVAGTGPVAVKVAEKLRSRRLAVSILAPGGVLPLLNAAPRRVVSEALSSWGIDVMDAGPERIVGVDRVEAVVAAGEVVPADCIAIVPRFAPCVPQLPVGLGRSGGVVVDEMGRSSLRSLYAAGDCAEVRAGNTTIPVMFESSAKLMGAVSGANASGAHASGPVVGSFFMELAGIGVASAGLGVADSTGLGLEPGESSMTWKGDLACSLVYDARSKTVLGVQLAGKGVASLAETLPIIVASRMTVNQLAYLESLSSGDVSPIKETARTGAARQ
jgi:NADPH-dependent 2,4-dienoyl-CoA reductase/sulfur reductase-like enzyme